MPEIWPWQACLTPHVGSQDRIHLFCTFLFMSKYLSNFLIRRPWDSSCQCRYLARIPTLSVTWSTPSSTSPLTSQESTPFTFFSFYSVPKQSQQFNIAIGNQWKKHLIEKILLSSHLEDLSWKLKFSLRIMACAACILAQLGLFQYRLRLNLINDNLLSLNISIIA